VTPKNLAASVHARLAQIARRTNRPFQETLQYFAMERFLYRLCRSPYAERFVLKGALMLRVWDAPTARPTKDVDLLGRMANSLDNLASVVREICPVEVEPDGLMFQETTVRAERIKVDADYQGVRVRFLGMLGKAKIAMQLDVGFGDVVVPDPEEIDYPALLEFPRAPAQGLLARVGHRREVRGDGQARDT
jgi:Nucleotidyl transferase AbiEii toxin, Type IV TA system